MRLTSGGGEREEIEGERKLGRQDKVGKRIYIDLEKQSEKLGMRYAKESEEVGRVW